MTISGLQGQCDQEGFLRDLNVWSESIAVLLAEQEGIALTDQHWEVLRLLRDFYQRTETAPAMRPFLMLVNYQL